MADPNTTNTPNFTSTIDQSFFIEPLGGPTHPRNYLDRFPEEVYDKDPSSHFMRFMYSLLGPAGVGWLRKNYLDARLKLLGQFETFDIERYYGDPFRFGRILSEQFDVDPFGLLPKDDWDKIKAQDEGYRSRAITYFNAARMGGTPEGMALAARSGLNHNVEIIENYKYLFDIHSDEPKGLPYFGRTDTLAEFIVLPRQEISHTEVQTITFEDTTVAGGTFILAFRGVGTTNLNWNASFQEVQAALRDLPTIGSNAVTVTGGLPLIQTTGDVSSGSATVSNVPETDVTNIASGSYITGTGIPEGSTVVTKPTATSLLISQNATATNTDIELTAANAGQSNFAVTFTGGLSNQDVPDLVAFSNLTDINGVSKGITVRTVTGGVEAVDEVVQIPDAFQHNMQTALDYLRPVNSLPTTADGAGTRSRQIWNRIQATSEYTEVVRYITGNEDIAWPDLDIANWIVANEENEVRRIRGDLQHHYVSYLTPSDVAAYQEAALTDPAYATSVDVLEGYNSEHVGQYTPQEKQDYPILSSVTDNGQVFVAKDALADCTNQLEVTTQDDDTGTSLIGGTIGINDNIDDLLTAHVAVRPGGTVWWSSIARPAPQVDFLEIDMGSGLGLNFVQFQILGKPISVTVEYDILDASPSRHFYPVTPWPGMPYTPIVAPAGDQEVAWTLLSFFFLTDIGATVRTRYIRLGFARTPFDQSQGSAFVDDQGNPLPYTIDVQNLSVGFYAAP